MSEQENQSPISHQESFVSKTNVIAGVKDTPSKIVEDIGEVRHTKVPKQRKPVEAYLELQGRFRHLFEPKHDKQGIAEIQARVDAYWDKAVPR